MDTASEQQSAPLTPSVMQRPLLPSISDLITETFRIYKHHIKTICVIAIVPIVIAVAPFYINEATMTIRFEVVTVLAMVANYLAYIAMFVLLYRTDTNTSSVGDIYKHTGTYVFRFIWVGIVSGFVALGAMLFFFIPAIYISLLISFAPYIVIAEGKRGMEALVQSWHYARGYWLAIMGRSLLFSLLAILVISATWFAFYMLASIFVPGLIDAIDNTEVATKEENVLESIVSALFTVPIGIIFTSTLFNALRSIKPATPSTEDALSIKKKIMFFGWCGVILVVALIGLITYFVISEPGLILPESTASVIMGIMSGSTGTQILGF